LPWLVSLDPAMNQKMSEATCCKKGAVRNTWQDYAGRLLAEYERRLSSRQSST
jgi:hypothetical protein